MSKLIGAKEVKRRLSRISNERGYEYEYQAPLYENEYGEEVQALECYYTDPSGNPSCIVGELLKDVAPSALKRLHQYEWGGGYEPNCIAVPDISHRKLINGVDLFEIFEPEAVDMLIRVQKKQDSGMSWGEAVDQV